MAGVLQWLKSTSTKLLDPNREQRVAEMAGHVEQELYQQRGGFQFQRAVLALGILPEDVDPVREEVFKRTVDRVWRDEQVSDKERNALDTITKLLELSRERAREIELDVGLAVFQAALARAVSDGILDDADTRHLSAVAAGLGLGIRELMLHYFSSQGEALFRSMFVGLVEDGKLDAEEWDRLVGCAQGFGLMEADLRRMIVPQAEQFVEHVLADAKADERLTEPEQRTLSWLLTKLGLSPEFRQYVSGEIQSLRAYTEINEGRLPSLPDPGVALRAGEIVHFAGSATWYNLRNLQSGPRYDRHDGFATITDSRFLFSGSTKTLDINHRKVVGIVAHRDGIELRTSGKGTGVYTFGDQSKLAHAIYRVAVGRANQTIVDRSEGLPTRHIPRDVRQRVWQRYCGRCADCGATQYLEFDHIVPVAKGGNNGDLNVQLLCRGCNNKKRDNI